MPQRCIVIGASAGGFELVLDIASQLPADLPAPVFVTMHVPAHHPSHLPEILNQVGSLRSIHPTDGAKIEAGFIYVAPPDHHLLIDDGHVAVKKGPKENGFRPSIDALFRSAAYTYGPNAIGVVLSGALHDGASGLWSIKRLGGIAIVQDPYEAQYPSMPRSALEYVEADYRLLSREISPLLVQLTQEQSTGETHPVDHHDPGSENAEDRIAKEVQIAAGTNLSHKTILDLGEFTPFTCPECHGALVKIVEGKLTRFRCHTGHGFSAEALLEAVMESTGEMIWQVARGLQEGQMLLEHMGRHFQENGNPEWAGRFFSKARELDKRASHFQDVAQDHESMSSSKLEDFADESAR